MGIMEIAKFLVYMLVGAGIYAFGYHFGWKHGKTQNDHPAPAPLDERALEAREQDLKKAREAKRQWDALMAYNGRGRGDA